MTPSACPAPHRLAVPKALMALMLALLAACSTGAGSKPDALDRTLYDYSGAIRWNNFEVAYEMVDPEVRTARPMSNFEFERLKQIQVTRYDLMASSVLPDGRIAREVEIGLVNRHTQAERSVRVRETWRYDETAQRWWQTEGLPNFAQDR